MNRWNEKPDISEMVGKTMTSVTRGEHDKNDALVFRCEDGTGYRFTHWQDCCESVEIDDIAGDLSDLVGSPLVMAEEISSEPPEHDQRDDSETWTFYKFATVKGSVTVRWCGSSNGYYSESVDLERLPAEEDDR